jgi:hypothetical protein
MWTCAKCGEQIEETFDACWKCGTSRDGVEDPEFVKQAEAVGEPSAGHPIYCARCDQPLTYMGTKKFHEGTRWGALGDIGELFVHKEHFDVYCCPRCGRVEFFVDGIGEEFRPK